jgi:tight adherence protein B
MTLWMLLLGWGLSISLLAPRTAKWLMRQQRRAERSFLRRLENVHIFLRLRSIRGLFFVLIIFSIVVGVGVFRSIPLFLAFSVVGVAGLFVAVQYRTAKRIKAIRYQLPGVVELVATSLRSGMSIRSAFLQVTRQAQQPIQQELAILERMQRIGIPLDMALSDWAKKIPAEELRLLVFTVGVSSSSGGNLADALDRLAAAWRQHLILEEKVDALTAQGRLQAWVMAALPMVLAAALAFLDPASMQSLWTTTAGHFVIAVVLILELAGLFWIRRLARVEV